MLPIFVLQAIVNGLLIGLLYALTAEGLGLTWGVLKVINMACGAIIMMSMYATFWIYLAYSNYLVAAIGGAMLGGILGIIIYKILVSPVMKDKTYTLITTFAAGLFLQNTALTLWSPNPRPIETPFSSVTWDIGGILITESRLIIALVALGAALLFYVFLKRTYLGKAMRATAQQPEAASLVGVNTSRIYMITFFLGCFLLGLAGVLLLMIYPVYPTAGDPFIAIMFIIVVLGGLGSYFGIIVGGIIIGCTETLTALLIGSQWQSAFIFIIFITFLILKPEGLFGKQR